VATLTDEQREAIREKRQEIGNTPARGVNRQARRQKRKELKAAAACHGLGRSRVAQFTAGGRKAKPKPRAEARHFGVTWSLVAGDLAVLCRDTWLRSELSEIRRTLPQGSLVVIDSIYDGTHSLDFKRNKCRVFFDGHIWDYMPIGHLRPIADYDDDDEEDEE